MITTARQLKDLIRDLSKKKSADAQIFNLMLEDRTIEVWAYNLETVLAEKLETVVSRNVTNTRMRDFYDIYILQKLYGEQLQKQVLWTALVATAQKRGTLDLIEAEDIREIFNEIESSPVMENISKKLLLCC